MSRLAAVCLVALLGCLAAAAPGAVAERVRCGSTTGDVVIDVHREWSPLGAERFLELVNSGFFNDAPIYRVVPNFIAQFGAAADPEVTRYWHEKAPIMDDPSIGIPVRRGYMSFAGGAKDSRKVEMWIAFQDNEHLADADGQTPFAEVVQGMENVDQWYSGYGDVAQWGGHAPDQGRLYAEGNTFTRQEYPELSYLTGCALEQPAENHQEQQHYEEPAAQEPQQQHHHEEPAVQEHHEQQQQQQHYEEPAAQEHVQEYHEQQQQQQHYEEPAAQEHHEQQQQQQQYEEPAAQEHAQEHHEQHYEEPAAQEHHEQQQQQQHYEEQSVHQDELAQHEDPEDVSAAPAKDEKECMEGFVWDGRHCVADDSLGDLEVDLMKMLSGLVHGGDQSQANLITGVLAGLAVVVVLILSQFGKEKSD